MKILFLIGQGVQVGGTEGQAVELARRLSLEGHETRIHVFCRGDALVELMNSKSVPWTSPHRTQPVDWLKRSSKSFGPKLAGAITRIHIALSLRRVLKQFHPDVVHAFLPECIATGLAITKLSARSAKRVAGIRGASPASLHQKPRFRRSLYKRVASSIRSCDAIICNSPFLVESELIEFDVPTTRIHVIPNGLVLPATQASPSQEPPMAIVVANFQTYKGHDVLIRALKKTPLNLKVKLCGVGSERLNIVNLVRNFGLEERVIFINPPADIESELRTSQFGIHPSLTEGLSNAILEEMASGLPVVATNVGGATLQILHDVSGLIVEPGDADALAQAITIMSSNVSKRVSMGRESRLRAEAYSWDVCVESHLNLYSSLFKEARESERDAKQSNT